VIGEERADGADGAGAGGAGSGEGSEHEIESSAYDLGRILGEKFELPNLKSKGKKRSLTRYTYDLTDRHEGSGQLLDKKATLRKIIETNIALDNIADPEDIDPARLLVSPQDEVYRILSKEKDYESQAMVFFLRDYSGSMAGKPTEVVVTQHVLIYSWLLFQYEKQVETRFILHDTVAKEVSDFYTYYNSSVAGGTRCESAYRLVNEIVEAGNLARDYNIYVFHGTDGDDGLRGTRNHSGNQEDPDIRQQGRGDGGREERGSVQRRRKIHNEFPPSGRISQGIRLDSVGENATEVRLIEGIKKLLS